MKKKYMNLYCKTVTDVLYIFCPSKLPNVLVHFTDKT